MEASYYLPLETVNEGNALLSKMQGVLDMMQSADMDNFGEETLSNTAWLLSDMVTTLREIIAKQR